MPGLDAERIVRERPERLEVGDVMATPVGGPVGIFARRREQPLTVSISDPTTTVLYLRWEDDGEVVYWREDIWADMVAGTAS